MCSIGKDVLEGMCNIGKDVLRGNVQYFLVGVRPFAETDCGQIEHVQK